mmetsp:Transcript_9294/g.21955  ORF Transcript_9294/g.21955 Transcript_9294/m.21955 type:complete len:565 (+) Transcript_9294:67-1761(+)
MIFENEDEACQLRPVCLSIFIIKSIISKVKVTHCEVSDLASTYNISLLAGLLLLLLPLELLLPLPRAPLLGLLLEQLLGELVQLHVELRLPRDEGVRLRPLLGQIVFLGPSVGAVPDQHVDAVLLPHLLGLVLDVLPAVVLHDARHGLLPVLDETDEKFLLEHFLSFFQIFLGQLALHPVDEEPGHPVVLDSLALGEGFQGEVGVEVGLLRAGAVVVHRYGALYRVADDGEGPALVLQIEQDSGLLHVGRGDHLGHAGRGHAEFDGAVEARRRRSIDVDVAIALDLDDGEGGILAVAVADTDLRCQHPIEALAGDVLEGLTSRSRNVEEERHVRAAGRIADLLEVAQGAEVGHLVLGNVALDGRLLVEISGGIVGQLVVVLVEHVPVDVGSGRRGAIAAVAAFGTAQGVGSGHGIGRLAAGEVDDEGQKSQRGEEGGGAAALHPLVTALGQLVQRPLRRVGRAVDDAAGALGGAIAAAFAAVLASAQEGLAQVAPVEGRGRPAGGRERGLERRPRSLAAAALLLFILATGGVGHHFAAHDVCGLCSMYVHERYRRSEQGWITEM